MADGNLQQRAAPPRRRRLLWIAVTLLLTVFVLAAGGGAYYWHASDRPEPVTIGFADTFTDANGFEVEEARAATQLYFNEVNAAGGIDGHMLELEAYNDRGQPAKAKADAANILAGRSLAVLGRSSDTSAGAEADYREGRIASVTGNATVDGQPDGSAYYFRAQSPNSAQAAFLAEYIRAVLLRHTGAFFRAPDIDLVGGTGAYARSFLAGFQQGDGGAKRSIFTLAPGPDIDGSAKAVADQLADQPEPRIIVVGLPKDATTAVLKAIRRRGIRSMVILSSSAASDEFVQQFADEPEEKDEPGFFTDNLFAIAPVILDNTGLLGQGLVTGYWNGTGEHPGWFAAGAEDAARLVVEAIRRAHIGGTEASKQEDRQKIRDVIAGFDNPANALPGISSALYFDARREMPRPMQYGYFHEGRFVSAPLQLVQVKDRDLVDIAGEIAQGHMVQIGEQFFWLQRVVATGINIARINSVDTKEGTFNADFFLWIRYAGGDELPSQLEFSDFRGNFDAAHPLRTSIEDGIVYKLWRVNGTFKVSFNLHDYPFDTQALVIRLQNRDHPRDQIVYAIDTFGLEADARGLAGKGSDAFSDLQLWQVVNVAPFVTSFSIQSALGQPALFGTPNRTEYGGFALAVLVKRNVVAFMVKALLPLFLLTLVVFATLFFPPSMAKERLTIPVTGILTSAVLMISINNTLPPLGYTTALEYIFYTFFLLCLMALVVGLLAEILRNKTFHHHVIKVDLFGRIAYVTIVATTVGFYLWKYAALV